MASTAVLDPPASRSDCLQETEATRAPLKVLHVVNGEHYAGAERVQDLLAAELGKHGFQVGFACLKPDQFPETRHCREAPLYELPMRHAFDLRPAWRLARLVRREGYQLIHSHTARSALIAALTSLVSGVPHVHHVHSPTSRDSTRRFRGMVNSLIERMVLRRAAALVPVSKSLRGHALSQGFRDDRITVVPNGVPSRRPRPDRDPTRDTWTLGTVALLRPRKGLEVLLTALAELRSQGLRVRLRAVGTFETREYEQQIKRLTKELGLSESVEWTGFTQDVDAELAKMDVFVLPSLFGEGLPMVVLEAMAAGVPVVATRVEGLPEAIRDGRDGLIAVPGDPHALTTSLRRLISGKVDWNALRQSALRRHAEHFSEASMAGGVADVYRRVLGAKEQQS